MHKKHKKHTPQHTIQRQNTDNNTSYAHLVVTNVVASGATGEEIRLPKLDVEVVADVLKLHLWAPKNSTTNTLSMGSQYSVTLPEGN